jgi:hypothetical protein
MHDLTIALFTIGVVIVPLVLAAKTPTYKDPALDVNLPAQMNLHALRQDPNCCCSSECKTNIQSRDEL